MFDGLHLKRPATGECPSRSFKVTDTGAIRYATYDFLLVFHWKYASILYRFRDITGNNRYTFGEVRDKMVALLHMPCLKCTFKPDSALQTGHVKQSNHFASNFAKCVPISKILWPANRTIRPRLLASLVCMYGMCAWFNFCLCVWVYFCLCVCDVKYVFMFLLHLLYVFFLLLIAASLVK